ncbi:MAG: hypothetical protein IKJ33_03185 [Clostridia bacterium]|nr:hypothetical protein [Clostridia bacterium]
MQPEKVYVSWKDMEEFVDSLIEEMNKQNFKPTGVYGIPRGGLILATLISYKLDIPLLMNASKDCLIIDDIADSGRTLLHYTENDTQFNRYFIATMYYHQRSIVKPNYYKFEKNDKWIVFPWEE